jgi:ERCC4-type nuclease
VTILIDSRIGSRELAPLLPPIPCELTRLEYGDCSWVGNGPDGPVFVGVERKRLRDLLNSMESGRLINHQLLGMSRAYHYSYVVIEGIWRVGESGVIEIPKGKGQWTSSLLGSRKFPASVMDNFTNTLSVMLNTTVVFTPTMRRTSGWISNIYRWWTSKQWRQHRSANGTQRVKCRNLPVTALSEAPIVARVAMELARGVGGDKAMSLARVFASPEELMEATRKELELVPGIGPTLAKGLWEGMHGAARAAGRNGSGKP